VRLNQQVASHGIHRANQVTLGHWADHTGFPWAIAAGQFEERVFDREQEFRVTGVKLPPLD